MSTFRTATLADVQNMLDWATSEGWNPGLEDAAAFYAADPEGFFQGRLRTGAESRVNLEEPVPVHIIYRTAFTNVTGELQFRRDVYGRDARIWNALANEGVVVRPLSG